MTVSALSKPFMEIVHAKATQIGWVQLSEQSGVNIRTIRRWRDQGCDARIADAEAILNVCGLTIVFAEMDGVKK